MNKIMLVGRFVRDPINETTESGIKWSRFTIAVDRPYNDDQVDYIPIVAWRNQAEFVENYMTKGSLVSIEGRFTSSSYVNNEGNQITRYEVTVDRIQGLESRTVTEARKNNTQEMPNYRIPPTDKKQVLEFAEENKKNEKEDDLEDVPWDLDL